ncbi:MAG: hypothetical protein DHS20C16_27360 [Phycisphaerae bacterium]|nr:MAG: hypothetical protein DHS20C16_27360 [Phycisphaerae bacterium]
MPQIRLIDQDSAQRGVVDTYVALREARDLGLDLVEIAPHERPPVCRIMDYGRHQYTLKKRQKQSATHEATLKEVRLRPKTDDNDRNIKIARAEKFMTQGHKVQFTMLFRGRERQHSNMARDLFMEIIEHFGESVKVERMPKSEGRRMTMVIAPTKKMIQIKPKKKSESTKKAKQRVARDNADAERANADSANADSANTGSAVADESAPPADSKGPSESSEKVDTPSSDPVKNDMVTNEERS